MYGYKSTGELIEEFDSENYTDKGEYSEEYQETEEYESLDEIIKRMAE